MLQSYASQTPQVRFIGHVKLAPGWVLIWVQTLTLTGNWAQSRGWAFFWGWVLFHKTMLYLTLCCAGYPWFTWAHLGWCWLELCIICLLQSVRTFFRKNMDTCLEWLSHVRGHIVSIAIHAGMPAVAIRHGFAALKDLVKLHVCVLCVRVHVSLICSWHHEENQDKC